MLTINQKPDGTAVVPRPSRVTKLRKAQQQEQALVSRSLEVEDEFRPYYGDNSPLPNTYILEPPYAMESLQRVCKQNNTLGACIDAMETNIDGTGHVIENKTGETDAKKDPKIESINEFFQEVYPGLSFLSLRRLVRRDLEQTGNGYIEVLRNALGQITFLRHVPSRLMRLLRLDGPIVVNATVTRGGEEVTVPVMVRERRYIQMIGMTFIYFREFNSSRQVDFETGSWSTAANPIAFNRRGTEVIHLTLNPDTTTPYGVPRWEGAIPAALGSRKAEEFNLEFFDTGGLPPALVTITGGYMAEDVKRALETQLNGKNKSKHRITILEVQATGGTIDKAASADVKVETFGQDKTSDALFQKYDLNAAEIVRRAFRLPAMFVGDSTKMLFAVAYTSYVVAESQIFRPDRDEFDLVINNLIMPGIGFPDHVYRSKGLSITDIMIKLQGLQLAMATNYIDPKDAIGVINELADLDLKPLAKSILPPGTPVDAQGNPLPPAAPGASPTAQGSQMKPGAQGNGLGQEDGKGVVIPGDQQGGVGSGAVKEPNLTDRFMSSNTSVFKTDDAYNDVNVLALADKAMVGLRKRDYDTVRSVVASVDAMDESRQKLFKSAMALRQYFDPSADPEGLSDLAGCTMMAMVNGDQE